MEELFKKFLHSGVGLVTATVETVQQRVNELVERGKITEEEGKKVVDDLLEDIDSKKDEYEGKVRGLVENVLAKFDFPTRREVEELEAKIVRLEALLNDHAPATEPTKAKKRDA